MTSQSRTSIRLTLIIIAANLLINGAAVFSYNLMRQSAMRRASAERGVIQHKLDAAWTQRQQLAAETIRMCRK